MARLIKGKDIFKNENEEYDIDDFQEQHINLNFLKENINNLDDNTVYYLQSPDGIFDIRIEKIEDELSISFEEHIYTKFWSCVIPGKKYVYLKYNYFKEKIDKLSIEIDFEDECHLFFRIDLNVKPNNITSLIESIVDINNQFNKNIVKLNEEINKTIDKFKFE